MKKIIGSAKVVRKTNGRLVEYTYNVRTTKNATGCSKTMASQKKAPMFTDKSEKQLKLCLYGNFDALNNSGLFAKIAKKVMKEHPTDKGYFKEVFVLSDSGKRRLRDIKRKISRQTNSITNPC